MGATAITPQQIAKYRMFQSGPQNPLYPPDPNSAPAPDPSQSSPAPAPSTPAPDASQPQRGSIAASMAPQGGSPGASPQFHEPQSEQDYLSQNPDASKAFMPARPVGDFDTGEHPAMRHALASLFAGMAEFGRPGAGTAMANRWQDQSTQQRQYDANQPKLAAQAGEQAYDKYLGQGEKTAEIQKSNVETQNLEQNNPAMQRKQQFLTQLQGEAESGKFDPQSLKAKYLRMAQFNRVAVDPSEIDDIISGTKPVGPKYQIQQDKNGRPEFATDRQGNRIMPDAKGNFQDPELKQQWDAISQSHQQGLAEEEGKEKRVAGFAAERQAVGFQQAQTMEGRKAAQPHLNDINDAKNQQTMMEQLTSGKMNPASQTAAMFKMIGLEQPTGTHRIMPAEIEGIEHLGGLSDRLKQKLLNWKEGDRFSPDMVPDVMSTAKILTQNKIKTANDNLESTYRNTGYKVPGTDASGRLDKPEDYQQPQAAGAGGQGGAKIRARDPQGKLHEAPAGTALPQGWKAEQ